MFVLFVRITRLFYRHVCFMLYF